MRCSHVLLLSLIVPLLAIIWYPGAYPWHQPSPRLIIDASVDQDFAAVIQETWGQFLLAFATRTDCFGDVLVKADYDLVERAVYDPQTATVSVRVPEKASILRGALVHEWAHHVEFQCEAHTEMQAPFIEAQGMPANTPWRLEDGTTNILSSDWVNIPSEQYAETVIVLVLGNRPVSTNAPIADRIVILENGRKILDTPKENMEAEELEQIIRDGGRLVSQE